MSPPSLAEYLERSLGLLRRHLAEGEGLVATALGEVRVLLLVDAETVGVCAAAGVDGRPGRLQLTQEAAAAAVAVRTSRRTILRVIDGQLSILGAVAAGELDAQGPLAQVADCHDALRAYVHAAVRCPGFSELLEQFRRDRREESDDVRPTAPA